MEPYRYFKYRFVNKNLFKSLVNWSLHFALPSNLNDPFDCQIDISKSALFAASKVSGIKREVLLIIANTENFADKIQRRMKEIGVCSFSEEGEDPIMWSHYADEHRGVCLLYEFTENFLLDEVNDIIGATKILKFPRN